MKKKTLIYILIVTFVIVIPICVCASANTYSYDSAGIRFSLDENWIEQPLHKKSENIDRMFESYCGEIYTGIYDFYGNLTVEETNGLSREEFNYDNLFRDDKMIRYIYEKYYNSNYYDIASLYYPKYVEHNKIKYIRVSGTLYKKVRNQSFGHYYTIINGYLFTYQSYGRLIYDDNLTCLKLKNINYLDKLEIKDNKMEKFNIISFLAAIILTFISYMIYPFVKVVLMKKKYNKKEANKMAMWNSIIIGFIFLVLTSIFNENVAWSVGPAFLYYCINQKIWVNKVKNDLVVSNYVEQKYSDLTKLKELLDNKVITNEEFEREKQKILDS